MHVMWHSGPTRRSLAWWTGDPTARWSWGLQFRPTVNGTITGVQFYKASTNSGTHVANLWSSNGTLLATATFTAETASGWQQVLFSSPVAITANTVYTVSYHALNGHYSADQNYFPTTGADNSSLQADRGRLRVWSHQQCPDPDL